MATTFSDLVRVSTSTVGTGTITLGAAIAGFLDFSSLTNGVTVSYAIEDGLNREVGHGVYSSSGPTLTRTVTKSTNSNAAISLSGSAQVFIVFAAEDFLLANMADVNLSTAPTDGQVLAWSNTGSKWQPATGTSGGGYTPLGGAWTDLAFSTSITPVCCGVTIPVYASTTTIALAAGQRLEVEGYIHAIAGADAGICISADNTNGYRAAYQVDDNRVLYRFTSGSTAGLGASGNNGSSGWAGKRPVKIVASVDSDGSNRVHAAMDDWGSPPTKDSNANLVGNVVVYVDTDNISLCSVQYRVI